MVSCVVVARNGKIYLSDATSRFSAAMLGITEASMLDVIEQSCTGRVLEFDPATTVTRVLAKGLCFANGVAMNADESALLVAETGRYRVWKVSVSADALDMSLPSPLAQLVLDNLPGYPDNLVRGLDGKIWLGLSALRNDLDSMSRWPFLRKLMLRLPRALWPIPKPYGHVFAFTEDGKVVEDLQDPSGASHTLTGASETKDRLYFHNLTGHGIGYLSR